MTAATLPYTAGLGNINNLATVGWLGLSGYDAYNNYEQGNYIRGTLDLGFATMFASGLNNKLKHAYNTTKFNAGKFPNLTNVTNIGGVNITQPYAGQTSNFIRQNVAPWSIGNPTRYKLNSLHNIEQLKLTPTLTQGALTTEFGKMLELEKLKFNSQLGFQNIVPKYNLLPNKGFNFSENYKLGDYSKSLLYKK